MIYDKEIHKTSDGFKLVTRYYDRHIPAKVEQEFLTFSDVRKAYDELKPCDGDRLVGLPAIRIAGNQYLGIPADPDLTPYEEAVYSCR